MDNGGGMVNAVGRGVGVLACLFCLCSEAIEGVVVVLEAPLFKAPQMDALVVQRFRKGDVISLPEDFVSEDPLFYRVLDRNGRSAYMLERHVKLVTNDERESDWPINSFDPDLTDYRFKGSLPARYPFKRKKKERFAITWGPTLTEEQTYQFAEGPQSVEVSSSMQFFLQYTRENPFAPIEDERESRFYFGGFARFIFGGGVRSQFNSGDTAEESAFGFALGPLASYDLFRRDENRFVVWGGIGVNIVNSHSVQLSGEEEGHIFKAKGIGLAPTFSFLYRRQRFAGLFDLMAGLSGDLVLPREMHSQEPVGDSPLLGSRTSFKQELFIHWSLSLGIQRSL